MRQLLLAAMLLAPSALVAEAFTRKVSYEDTDRYKDEMTGQRYLTNGCYRYQYYKDTTVVLDGSQVFLIFDTGKKCLVHEILSTQ
jgi:hypothetical protein